MLIPRQKSIISACDVQFLKDLEALVSCIHEHPAVGAFKVGLRLALAYGLPNMVSSIRKFTNKPIIYDHQKAGNDIPDMGEHFAEVCKESGVDAVILFPFTGVATQRVWQQACKEAGLHVIVGGEMTHPKFDEFISHEKSLEIYAQAVLGGVTDFVLPGNKLDRIGVYRLYIEETVPDATYYSPGLISQGGDITDAGKIAGDRWHAIIGRALYQAGDPAAQIEVLSKQL